MNDDTTDTTKNQANGPVATRAQEYETVDGVKYLLGNPLGKGYVGEVFEATKEKIEKALEENTVYALKRHLSGKDKQFKAEVDYWKSMIGISYVLPILASDSKAIVMPRMKNSIDDELEAIVKRTKDEEKGKRPKHVTSEYSQAEVITDMYHIFKALSQLAEKGLPHGDLIADNILRDYKGQLYLADPQPTNEITLESVAVRVKKHSMYYSDAIFDHETSAVRDMAMAGVILKGLFTGKSLGDISSARMMNDPENNLNPTIAKILDSVVAMDNTYNHPRQVVEELDNLFKDKKFSEKFSTVNDGQYLRILSRAHTFKQYLNNQSIESITAQSVDTLINEYQDLRRKMERADQEVLVKVLAQYKKNNYDPSVKDQIERLKKQKTDCETEVLTIENNLQAQIGALTTRKETLEKSVMALTGFPDDLIGIFKTNITHYYETEGNKLNAEVKTKTTHLQSSINNLENALKEKEEVSKLFEDKIKQEVGI